MEKLDYRMLTPFSIKPTREASDSPGYRKELKALQVVQYQAP
jgi:hypothetical protein